jgi:hypothetical protein
MNHRFVLRGAVLSAGLAVGLLAVGPSAYAQSWNGAPNATGPAEPPARPYMNGPAPSGPVAPSQFAPAPNFAPGPGGWATSPQPYWHGAGEAIGPA